MNFESFCEQKRQDLEAAKLTRQLRPAMGIDFCSNDYLSLSTNPKLKENILKTLQDFPLGSGGSRLLRGHSDFTEILEKNLARFSGAEEALFFPSGYQANLGLFSALLKESATVFSDELIHASIIDGIRLSGCEKYIWAHNDLSELQMLLKQKAKPDKLNFIVVESVYSMRGDFAPLEELCRLARENSCYLIVDEAHATGLFGQKGSGRVEELSLRDQVFATIHTAGKALGVSGAWIAGSSCLKDLLINNSRPFVYSTAPSFHQQVALLESIRFLAEERDNLIEEFFEKLALMQNFLQELKTQFNVEVGGVGGPVTALVVYENQKALDLMNKLLDRGFDVRAVRYPSVPKGEALLRITLPLRRSFEEIQKFNQSLYQSLKECQ